MYFPGHFYIKTACTLTCYLLILTSGVEKLNELFSVAVDSFQCFVMEIAFFRLNLKFKKMYTLYRNKSIVSIKCIFSLLFNNRHYLTEIVSLEITD